jgi:hypothetical protein
VVKAIAGTAVTSSLGTTAALSAGAVVTFGISVTQLLPNNQVQPLFLGTDYALDASVGQLLRLNPFTGVAMRWEAVPVSVSYFAGYQEVPPDVEDACLRLLTNRWFSRGRDPALKEMDEPEVGRRVYWVGGPPGSGGLPSEIADMVERYRVPVAL